MRITTFICVSFISLLVGCRSVEPNAVPWNQPDVQVDMSAQADAVTTVRATVEESVSAASPEIDNIVRLAEEGMRIAPNMPHWASIKASAEKLRENNEKLKTVTRALIDVEVQLRLATKEIERMRKALKGNAARVLELEGIVKKQKGELEDFESGIKARQQKVWLAVTAFSALLLAVGIGLFIFADKKLGIGLVVIAMTLTCVSYFMAQYVTIVAMIGGFLLFAVIAVLIYHVVTNRKALFETVESMEIIKPPDWKENDALRKEVRSVQSPKTEAIVDQVRKATATDIKAKAMVSTGAPSVSSR